MAKPTLFRITPFDAEIGATIQFEWNGAYQASNKIEVRERDADDASEPVYSDVYVSFKGKHLIPSGVLENGKIYKVRVRIETYAGDTTGVMSPSDFSDDVIFYCFETPVFRFDGLKTSTELEQESLRANSIEASSITLSLLYTQSNGEKLNSWTAYLYDASHTILQQTELMYFASKSQTYFSGLEDKSNVFVRATGTTVNGMEVDTGFIPLYVYYGLPGTFINFEAVNNENYGHIDLKSSIVSLLGTSGNGSDIEYVGPENLRSANLVGNYVTFGDTPSTNGSLDLNRDFTLYFKARNIKVISKNYENEFKFAASGINEDRYTLGEVLLYNAFLTLTDSKTGYRYSFTLWKTEVKDDMQYQVFLYCNTPDEEFGLWSEAFGEISSGQYLYLMVQRKDNTLSLKTVIKEG